ncbi:MAG: hypothetical protein AAF950_13500 [Pseudomonadota bacterium]
MTQLGEITIDPQFNGPPTSGNGGYCAGLLATFEINPIRVRLKAPVPLETPLAITRTEHGLAARHGGTEVMSAITTSRLATPPRPPSFEIASTGRNQFIDEADHGLPTCFVCGPHRKPGDGLCLFTGPVEGFPGVADVWRAEDKFCDEDGFLRPEIIWAALDCPSAFAINDAENLMLLGEIAVDIHARPKAGEDLIVTGWAGQTDGRKHTAGAALHRADGTLLAQSDTLWIELKQNP